MLNQILATADVIVQVLSETFHLWGARCREAIERGGRERESRLHPPFALHAPTRWAVYGYAIENRG